MTRLLQDRRSIVIVGPTAVGKSHAAVALAKTIDGEIISADSMQVYRRFDIGTGKLTADERVDIPHHGIDIVDPTEIYSAARFSRDAKRLIAEIQARNRWPIIVGGTGLYVKALLYGLVSAPSANEEIRRRHQMIYETKGVEALHEQLRLVDPESAVRLHLHDFVRISRALEVYELTGRTISAYHGEHRFSRREIEAVLIGIDPRETLRERIDRRIDEMLHRGWCDEVRALIASGYRETHPMGCLGYRQLRSFIDGEILSEEAVRLTKRDTWRFAKRQRMWFSDEPDVHWATSPEQAVELALNVLANPNLKTLS